MQIKLRKVLAMLSVLVMLCTLLPLGVIAADNLVVNGDFETGGVTSWNSGSSSEKVSAVADAAYSGSYGALVPSRGTTFTAYQDIAVEANADYTVTFWYKSILTSGSSIRPMYFGVYANNAVNTTATLISTQTELPYAQTEWTQVTTTFNSGSYTTVRLGYGCKSSSGQDNYLYVDDIVMTKDGTGSEPEVTITPDEEADGNLVANGYFNDGTATGWTVSGGVVEALNGDYALKATTTSRYSNVAEQTITVEANTDYTLDVESYYNGSHASGIARVHIYAGASGTSELASPSYYWNITAGAWDSHQLTFNSGENTQVRIVLQQHAAPNSSTAMDGNIYYDNFNLQKVVPAPDGNDTPSNDGYIINGDFETGDANSWTAVAGATVAYDKAYAGNFSMHMTANSGSYAYGLSQTVAVEKNTNYTVSFYYTLVDGTNIRLYICDGDKSATNIKPANGGSQPVAYGNSSSAVNGVWKQATVSFNSGENESIFLKIGGGSAGYGECYLDNFVMTKDANQPSPDEPEVGYVGSYPETMTSGADIRFMTYNVLVGQDTNKGGYSWGTAITGRPEKACAMINYYKPDVIALEEFSGEWYEYFQANMPDYAFGIMDSEDTQNNGILYTCIAYNVNTIRLLDTDLFRNTVSRWGTQGMRYVNVGFCEVIATGEKFIAAVTHPDAGNLVGTSDLNGDGVAEEGDGYWRPQQLEEAAAYVAGLSNEHKMPVIWGGDFNSGLDGTYDDNVSWYKVADAGFTDATAGRYIDHIFYNGMATHLYETTVADAAVNGASDHKAVFADIQFLDEFATPIKDAKDYIKTQGRNTLKDGALWLDFSASGIEFSANCEGKVALNLNVKSLKQTDSYGGLYFTVIVDGVKVDRAQCHITSTGDVELVLAENLPVGNHTFEVYRQTEHRGAEVGISSITMNGSFNEKPADNRLYIEFIGDSISTGFGALGTSSDSDGGSPKWQDATAAYPYLVAKALGADFSDVAYSGIGAKYGWQDPNMLNFYPYQRWQYDRTTQYNFNARQPDVVVIALGTNDIAMEAERGITLEQRLAGYQELLDLVRAKNPDAKIVWIYGMMKDDDNARIPAIIEENGGAAAGLYSLELVTNTAGAGWHPSAAGQQKFADDLVAYLNSDVLVRYVGDEVEDYDIITFGGNSIRENVYGSGLAFKFNVKTTGMAVTNKTQAVYDNAIVDVFGDGGEYKLVKMGAVVANTPACGDLKLDDVDDERVLNIEAVYLCNLTTSSASFSVRILDIPEDQQDTLIYARPYYVFEYEGREVIAYGDAVQANCNNKYDSNDGVLEW